MMTDEQVKQGFDEVYNQFWRKHKTAIPKKYAEEEWEAIHSQMSVITGKISVSKPGSGEHGNRTG